MRAFGEGGFILAVLRAVDHVDLDAIAGFLGTPVRIANDDDLTSQFSDCEPGAVRRSAATMGCELCWMTTSTRTISFSLKRSAITWPSAWCAAISKCWKSPPAAHSQPPRLSTGSFPRRYKNRHHVSEREIHHKIQGMLPAPFSDALILTGPTGSGKSQLGIELARRLDAEIISMDSMAFYRHMDIGTAKPSLQDRQIIRHHLVDVWIRGSRPASPGGCARRRPVASTSCAAANRCSSWAALRFT